MKKRGLLLASLLSSCTPDANVLYQSATADSRNAVGDQVKINNSSGNIRLYALKNGKLYLCVQITRNSLLYTKVEMIEWDSKKIKKIASEDPEFREALPNPKTPSGGIKWIK